MNLLHRANKLGICTDTIVDMIVEGRKIPAIKEIRVHLEVGLRTAKIIAEEFMESEEFLATRSLVNSCIVAIKNRESNLNNN